MRRLLLSVFAVFACAPEPGQEAVQRQVEPTAQALSELVDGYMALTQAWDPARAKTVLPPGLRAQGEAHFAWMRAQIGACQERRVLSVRSGDFARFELRCERGLAEVAFESDGRGGAKRMLAAARGVRPDPPVTAAARAIVGWRAARNPAPRFSDAKIAKAFERGFSASTVSPYSCRTGAALMASASGGVFAVHCDDREDLRLAIDLDRRGKIRRAKLSGSPVRG